MGTEECIEFTDAEIEDMQKQINKEAGLEPEDGGVDIPQGSDGITRYPSQDGEVIPPDDVSKYDGSQPPQDKGE